MAQPSTLARLAALLANQHAHAAVEIESLWGRVEAAIGTSGGDKVHPIAEPESKAADLPAVDASDEQAPISHDQRRRRLA